MPCHILHGISISDSQPLLDVGEYSEMQGGDGAAVKEDGEMTLVVSIVAIGVAAWLMMRVGMPVRTTHTTPPRYSRAVDGAIAYARDRLVRGEITPEDFERIVSVLRS